MNTSSINYYPPTSYPWLTPPLIWYIVAAIFVACALFVIFGARRMATERKVAALIIIGCVLVGLSLFEIRNQLTPTWSTPVFAPRTMLQTLWENYKEDYVSSSTGRAYDDAAGTQTTSEAEGYTMLRAVWMDDKPVFDATWQWTKTNLQRKDDLFSWLYGKEPDGTYGILTAQNGENSASDADSDIALALVFAYSRWQDPAYLQAATPIIKNIWKEEVFTAGGQPYLGPDNLVGGASSSQYELVDPSYLSPYAYRIFSFLDPQDDWNGLINSSYQILDKGIGSPLDATTSAGLPPDWLEVNTVTGAISAPSATAGATASDTTTFGYDALRVPFRIALDWEWYHDPRDEQVLASMAFLGTQWKQYGYLDAVYSHNGTPDAYYQTPAMYGGAMGYFIVADPGDAQAVYDGKLQSLYSPDTETWKLPLDYYDANIAWFGMALYNNDLPNLFTLNLPASSTAASSSNSL